MTLSGKARSTGWVDKWGVGGIAGVVASWLVIVAGCGGSLSHATGGADAGTDVGVAGEGGGGDASEAGSADVCGAFFDAFVACEDPTVPGDAIPSPLLPASEVARVRGRYETVCAAEMALPGTAFTASAVAACTAAIQSEGCISGEADPACSFSGTSASGASCADPALNDQCGDACVLYTQTDAGTFSLRQPCALAPFDTNGCGASAECNVAAPQPDGGYGTGTCIALTIVGAGQGCATFGTVCDAGTYCYSPSNTGTDWTCTPAGKAGDACPLQAGTTIRLPVRGSCAAPLFCSVPGDAGAGTCQAPGGSGASCEQDSECAAGLGCVPPAEPPRPGTCGTVTFVAAGQTCGGSARCLRGNCPPGGAGEPTPTCPAVTADGQPCPTNGGGLPSLGSCDAYATCINGTCTLGYATCP